MELVAANAFQRRKFPLRSKGHGLETLAHETDDEEDDDAQVNRVDRTPSSPAKVSLLASRLVCVKSSFLSVADSY